MRAQKVSSGREGWERIVFRFRVFCLHRLTSILQRGEEVPQGGGGGGVL